MKSSKRKEQNEDSYNRARTYMSEYIENRCDHKCMNCERHFPIECLDFHHLDPTLKLFSLSLRTWTFTGKVKETLDEAEKCVILCKCCHSLEHIALKRGETILNDKEAYIRYRDKRFSTFQSVADRDKRLPNKGGLQLQLSLIEQIAMLNQQIHRGKMEVRTASGNRIYDVVILGLSVAFGVNDQHTLTGRFTKEGIRWEANNAIAADVQSVIDAYKNPQHASFIKLPVNTGGDK